MAARGVTADRTEFAAFNAFLASRDYVVAAIDYRLAPQWRFPAARDDVLTAVAYLKVYATELQIDPTRIALLGRSGGAQLALLAAYTAQEPAIKGVISLYGPSNLRAQYENPAPPKVRDTRAARSKRIWAGLRDPDTDGAYYAASPVNFVNAASPPTLIVHGERDPIVSAGHASALQERLQQAGVKNLYVRLPWATHGCEVSYGGPCGQIVNYAVERFLDTVMTAPRARTSLQGQATATTAAGTRRAAKKID